jgi:hypothetical protein
VCVTAVMALTKASSALRLQFAVMCSALQHVRGGTHTQNKTVTIVCATV